MPEKYNIFCIFARQIIFGIASHVSAHYLFIGLPGSYMPKDSPESVELKNKFDKGRKSKLDEKGFSQNMQL
jgi:hypothetical protein